MRTRMSLNPPRTVRPGIANKFALRSASFLYLLIFAPQRRQPFVMENPVSSRILWNKAAQNGLLLGLFTAACRIVSQAISATETATAGTAVLNGIVWLIQFGGCLWLMKFFMERLAGSCKGVTNRITARYGRMLALTSGLVFSAAMFFDVSFISPETVSRHMDLYYQMYGSMLDENSRTMLRKIEDYYPQIMFFSTLIYSFVYGVVLSAILSVSIPRKDPFSSFMDRKGE